MVGRRERSSERDEREREREREEGGMKEEREREGGGGRKGERVIGRVVSSTETMSTHSAANNFLGENPAIIDSIIKLTY